MKCLEILLIYLRFFILLVSAFAFSNKKAINHTVIAIYYKDGTCNQKIPSSSGNEDCRENNLNSSTFTASNWTTTASSPESGSGPYLLGLVYDNADYSTISSVLSDLQDYYTTNGNLPSQGQDIVNGSKHITIRRTTSVH